MLLLRLARFLISCRAQHHGTTERCICCEVPYIICSCCTLHEISIVKCNPAQNAHPAVHSLFGVAKWRVGRKCDGVRVLVEVVGGQQCSLRGVALNSSSTHARRVSVRKASPCLHCLARFSRVGVISHICSRISKENRLRLCLFRGDGVRLGAKMAACSAPA